MSGSRTGRQGPTWRAAAGTTAGGAALGGGAMLGLSTYVARRVLAVDNDRPDDVEVLAVDANSLVLSATDETLVDGRYGLWLERGAGHARFGDILERGDGWVRRELLGVDSGVLQPGPGRFSAFYYASDPLTDLGLEFEATTFASDLGPMPAWAIPGPDTSRWAILVHGRGARRLETLRAVPALHAAGLSVLVPSYRNDEDAMPAPDGRYSLGLSEWRDLESAVVEAVRRGAREVVLVGWSMGGAIILQMLSQSRLRPLVDRVVLDAPVVDWANVLEHQARVNRVPGQVAALAQGLMGRRSARRLVGVHESVDVAQTDWVRRAEELTHRILLIHSLDDEFVPAIPSVRLAEARPDLVTFVPWRHARHTKEWNTEPERWERLVREFVSDS
ncbi:alpha/beta hydrolase family protein [Actinomycetota bacterium]